MIINEKLKKELNRLEEILKLVSSNNSLTDLQTENFLKNFESIRYNILLEIKLYNNTVEFQHEKIKTIDNEYNAELIGDMLKIYIPEIMPSFKNIKTHTYKRILLNISEITKPFANIFNKEVFIYIKVFDKIPCWDIDNKCIKPIADGLITSNVIKDDNIKKMFYCVKGEFSEIPHTEVYVFDSQETNNFLQKHSF